MFIRDNNITQERVKEFIEGRDPQERIVGLDYNSQNDYMTVIYRDELDRKCKHKEPFYPFIWSTRKGFSNLCGGDKPAINALLTKYNIRWEALDYKNVNGVPCEKMLDGYLFMFQARTPMAYTTFQKFFKEAGCPLFSDKNDKTDASSSSKEYLVIPPQQQFLIQTGKRFFKGYDDYNQLLRMTFDLETEGLDPTRHRIEWYGIRFNRPLTYKGVTKEYEVELELTGSTKEEKDASELKLIDTALRIIYTFKPDVITAHNGENFDWNFIIERCKQLGTSIQEMSSKYFEGRSIAKETRQSSLKLGGETEGFYRTIVPEITITDSLHAVRRAQATDSSFKKADLKYATQYLKMVKPNRVYTPGKDISKISNDHEVHYAFNEKNGDWYLYDPNYVGQETPTVTEQPKKKKKMGKKFILVTRNVLLDGYTLVDGHYIIERYLKDDLIECDMVEYALNGTDFMLTKIMPVPFQKVVTMGTAGQWKAIMLAWSYENHLAIPKPENTGAFTGGLSRLLRVGFVANVIKLDFNSLYPSIILTWAISDETDLMNAMLYMLEYVLTTRETHKKLKKKAEKQKDAFEERMNSGEVLTNNEMLEYNDVSNIFKVEDNRQASVKKLGNSYFGSYGSNNGSVFPWKSVVCAERTTCTGRMSLRLMISHFAKLGYEPIVGDSFTPDTPLFIKYKETGRIDIKPISELINEREIKIDALGREYDYSEKDYYVLCRKGWVEPRYIYRHKTNKDIYEVSEGDMRIEVTEDHSLFDSNKMKLNPKNVTEDTKLEYYTGIIKEIKEEEYRDEYVGIYACELADGKLDRVPMSYLNASRFYMKQFYETFMENYRDDIEYSKTCLAGLQYLKTHSE